MRYFVYRYSQKTLAIGKVTGKAYQFFEGIPKAVDAVDGDGFLFAGTPGTTEYAFRETDSQGNPVGSFPPVPAIKPMSIPVRLQRGLSSEASLKLLLLNDPTLRRFANRIPRDGSSKDLSTERLKGIF